VTVISLSQVSRTYPGAAAPAVVSVDLEIPRGELLALVGRSGSGKTTTLKMINRLQEASAGRIMVDQRDVAATDPVALRRHIGYVFQGIGLFPHMDVAANVAVVPRLLGWPEDEITARVNELLELVHLPPGEFAARHPRELSGGQQQRVGLARALAGRPHILLLDEPFGSLDPLTRDELQRELRTLHDQMKLTTVLVTHDMAEALLLADRIAVMEAGRLLQVGPPAEILNHPAHATVRRLISTPRRQGRRIDHLLQNAPDGTP
jgi:osmoprotectant transport system ATP-binding protein